MYECVTPGTTGQQFGVVFLSFYLCSMQARSMAQAFPGLSRTGCGTAVTNSH